MPWHTGNQTALAWDGDVFPQWRATQDNGMLKESTDAAGQEITWPVLYMRADGAEATFWYGAPCVLLVTNQSMHEYWAGGCSRLAHS